MKDLFLVRHGQAKSGPSRMDRDFGLTDEGAEQARRAGLQLRRAGVDPTRIFASRLLRARQTAAIIAEHVPAPIVLREDLIEQGSAVFLFEGTLDEAARKRPDALLPDGALRVEPGRGPGLNDAFSVGGESLRSLRERVMNAFRDILEEFPGPGEQVILVAHGSFLSAMAAGVLEMPARRVWNIQFANAGLLHLRFHADPLTGLPLPVLCIPPPNSLFTGIDRSEKTERNIDNT